jgi:hypothetical protein
MTFKVENTCPRERRMALRGRTFVRFTGIIIYLGKMGEVHPEGRFQ